MTEVKNLMFDLGGVIMKIRRLNAVEALEKLGLTDAGEMLGEYGQKGPFLALEKGLITPAEFRDELRARIHGSKPTDAELDSAFSRFLVGIPVGRLRELEALRRNHRIYLLSNTNAIMWNGFIDEEFRKDGHDISYYFDDTIASFDVKAYKPDAAIFLKAIEKFRIEPEQTLFFDDSETNCEAARAMGFNAVHVTDERPFAELMSTNGYE